MENALWELRVGERFESREEQIVENHFSFLASRVKPISFTRST